MGGKSSRDKGANAEREVKNLHNVWLEQQGYGAGVVKRNVFQSMEGGYDLLGLPFLAIEVKRCETLALGTWWDQCVRQAGVDQEPVLWYRQNRKPWRVRMRGGVGGVRGVLVDISIEDYFTWLGWRLEVNEWNDLLSNK